MVTEKDKKNLIERFLYVESSQIPLTEISWEENKALTIDPITGKPYKGIVLEGCFVDFSQDTPNNNNRIYTIPEYLELIRLLRKKIFTYKGVYGELEHPQGYNVDSEKVSHRLLDIWYVEKDKKVYGRVLILNEGRGLIAQQIIRSGGQLAISARAAGEEKKLANGSLLCTVKLLVTFDLVYHPGFSAAVLDFKCLNESQQKHQNLSESKKGFSAKIYDRDLITINSKVSEYKNLCESQNGLIDNCFYEWYLSDRQNLLNKLFESQQQQKSEEKQDEETIQDNETPQKDKYQDKLQKASQQDLKQNEPDKFEFFNSVYQNQKQQIKKKKLNAAYYDNSAGFVNEPIENPYAAGITDNSFTH